MTRTDLAKSLSREMKVPVAIAEKLVLSVCDTIAKGLERDSRVVYSNFGSFYVIKYPSKIINHPKGGGQKKMLMPETNVIKWMPSENIKDLVDHGIKTDTITSFGSSKKTKEKKYAAGISDHKSVELEEEISIPIRIVKSKTTAQEKINDTIGVEPIPITVTNQEPEDDRILLAEEPIEIAKATPVTRVIDLIFKRAIRDDAEAILFDPQEKDVVVRFKIVGKIFDKTTLSKQVFDSINTKMKKLAGAPTDNILPTPYPFATKIAGNEESFEYLCINTAHGEKVMINIEERLKEISKLTELDLSSENFESVKVTLEKPGIIFVASDSSIERTMLLYAISDFLVEAKRNIISIEKNPSLIVPHFNQVKVEPLSGTDYSHAIDFVWRFNPDALVIDELSDPALIEKVLLLSAEKTIIVGSKSSDTEALLHRLFQTGVDRILLAENLNMILATKSVSQICRSCRKLIKPDHNTLMTVRDELSTLPSAVRSRLKKIGSNFYESSGCQNCDATGFTGKTTLFELFVSNKKISELIQTANIDKIKKEAWKNGFMTLTQDGITRALLGQVSLNEILS